MINHIKLIITKIRIYLRYKKKFKHLLRWIFFDEELSNFTYKIKNKNEIIHIINVLTGAGYKEIISILDEVNINNSNMKKVFSDKYFKRYDSDIFGRRLIWYAITRIIKPDIVIESGVFEGLGSALLTMGLFQNFKENPKIRPKFIGIDIKLKNYYLNPQFDKIDIELNEIDSIDFLNKFNEKKKILYISDAKHDPEFEKKEYNLISKNLIKNSIIISDNGSEALSEFSILNNKKILCFTEQVSEHWYSGAKCTISYD